MKIISGLGGPSELSGLFFSKGLLRALIKFDGEIDVSLTSSK